MYSIINVETNELLISSVFDDVIDGYIAIKHICTIENPDEKKIFFNFETNEFYLENEN